MNDQATDTFSAYFAGAQKRSLDWSVSADGMRSDSEMARAEWSSILWSQVFISAIRASVISDRLLVPCVLRLVRASLRFDIFVQHLRETRGIRRTSESVVFEWIQEIDPELVKIAHVAGHDRQPMHQGRRGNHGILQQGV